MTIASIIIAASIIVGAYIFTSGSSTGPSVQEFDIVMQNNQYNPSKISVNFGDQVVLNFENKDNVAHGVELKEFGASVPDGHIFPGKRARMEFVANKRTVSDAAVCGGANPEDKSDGHGEELIVEVI